MHALTRLLLLSLLALPAVAQRSLYWDDIAVDARLDERGRLHVTEVQTIVFDGNWIGGERAFALEPGQRLHFEGMSRRDAATDGLIPMREGNLDAVDTWTFGRGRRVMWRSRLPSDPLFHNDRLTYVLDYTISSVLTEENGQYFFDYDFAPPDRRGTIRRLTVDLELSPAWRDGDVRRHYGDGPLSPRDRFVVRRTMRYAGAGAPPAARVDPRLLRLALAALTLLAPLLLIRLIGQREREKSAQARPLPPVTRDWIEENILPIPAEVVGTAWHERASAPEVSALLARWMMEGKISTTVLSWRNLQMRLEVPRNAFHGYERELIDRLFFLGDETSTESLHSFYEREGFDPSKIIAAPLAAKVRELPQMSNPRNSASLLPSVLLFVAVVALWRAFRGGDAVSGFTMAMLIALVIVWLAGMSFATLLGLRRGSHNAEQARGYLLAVGLASAAVIADVLVDFRGWITAIGLVVASLLVASNVFTETRSRVDAAGFRRQLAALRQYFIDELRKPQPAIDDRWFPYLVALGLDAQTTAWMSWFGARGPHRLTPLDTADKPHWTGGGSVFAASGVTGAWSSAAGATAAGVAGAAREG